MGKKNKKKTPLILIGQIILCIPILIIIVLSKLSMNQPYIDQLYLNSPHYIWFAFIICSTPILFIELWHSKTRINFALQLMTRVILATIYVAGMYVMLHTMLMVFLIISSILEYLQLKQ